MKIPGIEKITNIILLTLLLTASVAQNGKLLGIRNDKWFKADSPEATVEAPSADQLGRAGFQNASTKQLQKGIWEITVAGQATGKVIATLEYNRKTFGFAGPIPMYLFLDHNDEIKNVTILNNSEDKEFIDSAIQKGVLSQWAGLSVLNAVALKPDAVSGATMSSRAINTSIERSLSATHWAFNEIHDRKLSFIQHEFIARSHRNFLKTIEWIRCLLYGITRY